MSLSNLERIGRLHAHPPNPRAIRRMLASARVSLADAQSESISADSRFDAAYEAILKCALVGLWAAGYRTPSGQAGHHQTALQALPLTLGFPASELAALDALRRHRNRNDYEGHPIDADVLADCLAQAERVLSSTLAQLVREGIVAAG